MIKMMITGRRLHTLIVKFGTFHVSEYDVHHVVFPGPDAIGPQSRRGENSSFFHGDGRYRSGARLRTERVSTDVVVVRPLVVDPTVFLSI